MRVDDGAKYGSDTGLQALSKALLNSVIARFFAFQERSYGFYYIGAGAVRLPSARSLAEACRNIQIQIQIQNMTDTCDTGQTRNKLLEQWVHLTSRDVAADSAAAVAVPRATSARGDVPPHGDGVETGVQQTVALNRCPALNVDR